MSLQIAEIEQELEATWKSRMAEALASAKKVSDRQIDEMKGEKAAVEDQLLKLKDRVRKLLISAISPSNLIQL